MSRTKIVATYGPACESPRVFEAMLRGGLDVIRLNVSHLEPPALGATARRLRAVAGQCGLPLAVLADMPGPKIRCSQCRPDAFDLEEGDRVAVTCRPVLSTPREISVSYPYLLEDVRSGHELAINDGVVLLRVSKVDRRAGVLRCVVLRGGVVSSRKGVSFLHTPLRVPGLTARDREGLVAAARAKADFVALSFVRSPDDVRKARRILARAGQPSLPIVSKIEQQEAVEHFDEVLAVSDAAMVARGDMGIELPLERVPLLQKDIIRRCNLAGKAVITATQMLESMTEHSLPTRAEVTDVANAILDGSDAVMLSAETATGRDPARVVRTMSRIAAMAETRLDPFERLRLFGRHRSSDPSPGLDDSLAHAACRLASDAHLDAIVCLSFFGTTARRISRYRPACPVYVLSPHEDQARRLAITWGLEVFTFPAARPSHAGRVPAPGELIAPAIALLRGEHSLKPGHHIAMLAGIPLNTPGSTNWLRVVEV